MAFKTLARVRSVTYFVLLMTCETVAVETPASRATSLIRGVFGGLSSKLVPLNLQPWVATEGHPYKSSLAFVGVALRGHPRVLILMTA